jgi:hypothetical protein
MAGVRDAHLDGLAQAATLGMNKKDLVAVMNADS